MSELNEIGSSQLPGIIYTHCNHSTGVINDHSEARDDYCWRCKDRAKDLQFVVISLLPVAMQEEQSCRTENGFGFRLESAVERAIYAAQLMQERCLKEVAKE